MDVNLARTFVEVVNTGSFVRAAKRLNVSQSTVSCRIQSLEQQLGRQLFVRSKLGASLTPAGEQFQRFAISMTQVWEQACHQVAGPSGFTALLTVGGQASLWDHLLLNWLKWMEKHIPGLCVRAEYGQPDRLMVRLAEGMIDVGVMYTPQSRPGLEIERLFAETLVLVTTEDCIDSESDGEYVYTDWGIEFRTWHSLNFPKKSNARLHLALGTHGLNYLLDYGGAGYFPLRAVSRHVEKGRLRLVEKAPTFELPVYAVYATEHAEEFLESVLKGLRWVIATKTNT